MGNCYSSSPNPRIIKGSNEFKIINYSLTKGIGIGEYIVSGTFNIGGYNWIIKYYPDGFSAKYGGNGEYISLFLSIQGENIKEVKAMFGFMLVGPCEKSSSKTMKRVLLPRNFDGPEHAWGFVKYMKRDTLEELGFIKDDCLTIKCNVSVSVNPKNGSEGPTRDFKEKFSSLFNGGEGFDVSFEVQGETIKAHKCILIASSPVFKAELSGPMKERNMRVIKIEDMEAVIFKILLHFIYTDSFPDFEEIFGENIEEEEEMNALYQHLLVAADRYDLRRLRLICENHLAKSLNETNVSNILVLADQHNCSKLRDICHKYIASSKNLAQITAPGGFNYVPRIMDSRGK